MNFFDYELSRTATATPPQTAGESNNSNEPSLSDEVTQVVGQLGRLWGGFRRQSQAALETARKDFSSVVAQAQKEIDKLRTDANTSSTGEAETSTSPQEARPSSFEKAVPSTSPAGDDDSTPRSSSPSVGTPSSPTTFQTLLHRVQASLPPNVSSTLERTIPAALRDPSSHAYADIQHLRETLSSEFTRVQGMTRAQAEEYVHKSEALLREAGAYLKDAVRIIPPEEQGDDANGSDVVFDSLGSGIIVLPTSGTSNRSRSKGKARAAQQAQQRFAGSRAATMLTQLKNDPEVIRGDPLQDANIKDVYEAWLKAEVDPKENGIESSYWTQRIKEALDADDAHALLKTRDALVPSNLDSNTFWTRYFFRVYQIEKDEEKRKALLAASGNGNDEDFSWEDDDEESATPAASAEHRNDVALTSGIGSTGADSSSRDTLHPGGNGASSISYPESLVTSPSNTSPRESTDGYDVVSPAASSDVKSKVTAEAKDENSQPKTRPEKKEEDEGDSDWE